MSFKTLRESWAQYAAGAVACGPPVHPAEQPAYFAGAAAAIGMIAGANCCTEHMQARLEVLVREIERVAAEATSHSPRQGAQWDGRQ